MQNADCRNRGKESDDTRATCEKGIGLLDTLLSTTKPFVDGHLLYMLGASRTVVTTKTWFEELADTIDDIVGPALNPLRWAVDKVTELVGDYVKDRVRDATGVDVDQLRDFLAHPARWMCGATTPTIKLPARPGLPSIVITPRTLFTSAEHRRLDAFMALPSNHHRLASECSGLRDTTQFDPNGFAAVKDSITQAKLLLLDGAQLDDAFGDVLADAQIVKRPIHTYPSVAAQGSVNIMFTALGSSSVGASSPPWPELIDGDHAWRSNGLPRFRDGASTCLAAPGSLVPATGPPTDDGASTGGTGQYPPWASCVLRPAFRALFTDWESSGNFPDCGDASSPDPVTDPTPPAISITPASGTTTITGAQLVLPGATFTVAAHDALFTDAAIPLAYRTYASDTTPGQFLPVANGGTVALPAGAIAGSWIVEVQASDPCGAQTSAQTFGVA